MVKFKDFSRPLSAFQVLSMTNLIFKDFSRQSAYSSTFQACANPEACLCKIQGLLKDSPVVLKDDKFLKILIYIWKC